MLAYKIALKKAKKEKKSTHVCFDYAISSSGSVCLSRVFSIQSINE